MLHHQGINAVMWHSVLQPQVVPAHEVHGAPRHRSAGLVGKVTPRGSPIVGEILCPGLIGSDCFVFCTKAANPQKLVRSTAVYGEQKLLLISL